MLLLDNLVEPGPPRQGELCCLVHIISSADEQFGNKVELRNPTRYKTHENDFAPGPCAVCHDFNFRSSASPPCRLKACSHTVLVQLLSISCSHRLLSKRACISQGPALAANGCGQTLSIPYGKNACRVLCILPCCRTFHGVGCGLSRRLQ